MSFAQFRGEQDSIQLLQRSLGRGRLGHAYLLSGVDLLELESVARNLAKTLNCAQPPKHSPSGLPIECCDQCLSCRKIDAETHPDILAVRPESKSRVITIDQVRDLMQTINLKPTQAAYKVAIITGADRLNVQAANAFLKTLEEPPAASILILLTTEPQRVLETILSRCLRLNFAGEHTPFADADFQQWLEELSTTAATDQKSLLSRYRLLSVLLSRLNQLREGITERLTQRSPLEKYDDLDPRLRDKWEDELVAAIEAEYRRQRGEVLCGLQWWLRDIWLQTLRLGSELLTFPKLATAIKTIAQRLTPEEAMENLSQLEDLQRMLHSNVQEALALEVGLLKLKL